MDEAGLMDLYITKLLSVPMIANKLCVSEHKVNYWLSKYRIPKRSISEAIYLNKNPQGDPFKFKVPKTKKDYELFGLGLGLYWGEGNKRNRSSLRLGNVDPNLVKVYMNFLEKIFSINKNQLKFGLQIFSDISPEVAKKYWMNQLSVKSSQFQKVIITKTRGVGTYKHKSNFGVLTVSFNNTKLKKIVDGMIENLRAI